MALFRCGGVPTKDKYIVFNKSLAGYAEDAYVVGPDFSVAHNSGTQYTLNVGDLTFSKVTSGNARVTVTMAVAAKVYDADTDTFKNDLPANTVTDFDANGAFRIEVD